MVVIESGPLLADIVRIIWSVGVAFAVLKGTASPEHRHTLTTRYDPHILICRSSGGGIVVEERPAGQHPHPVTDGSITVFTSGTTGTPKGVVLGRDAVYGNATKTAQLHGFGHDRPHGTCLELFHVNALVMSLLGTTLTGEILLTNFSGNATDYFKTLDAGGARTASANPQVLRRIVMERPVWPKTLDYIITAAGPCSKNLATEFYELYGPRLRQGYGMSEAVNFSFMMPTVTDLAEFENLYTRSRPPVGLPLVGTDYRLVDGELQIRTADLMSGYLHAPTPDNISEGWLHTGDFAEVRDQHVVLLGRTSERLTTSGLDPAPGRTEDELDLDVDAGDYAVVQVPARPSIGLFTSGPLTATTLTRIHAGGLPISVLCGRALRVSPSGKIQRILMSLTAGALHDQVEADLLNSAAAAKRPQRLAEVMTQGIEAVTSAGLRPAAPLSCGCVIHGSSTLTITSLHPDCGEHAAEGVWLRSGTDWLLSVSQRTSAVMPPDGGELVRSVRAATSAVSLLCRGHR